MPTKSEERKRKLNREGQSRKGKFRQVELIRWIPKALQVPREVNWAHYDLLWSKPFTRTSIKGSFLENLSAVKMHDS